MERDRRAVNWGGAPIQRGQARRRFKAKGWRSRVLSRRPRTREGGIGGEAPSGLSLARIKSKGNIGGRWDVRG